MHPSPEAAVMKHKAGGDEAQPNEELNKAVGTPAGSGVNTQEVGKQDQSRNGASSDNDQHSEDQEDGELNWRHHAKSRSAKKPCFHGPVLEDKTGPEKAETDKQLNGAVLTPSRGRVYSEDVGHGDEKGGDQPREQEQPPGEAENDDLKVAHVILSDEADD